MSNDGKRCIFCPSVGKLTDEHVWGDWTRKYVPRPRNKHTFKSIVAKSPTEDVPEPTRIRAGDPLNAQVKVVCKPCNSGWMSQIQQRAKPYLIPLFDGQESVLNTDAQTLIATWATMSTMMGEHLSHDRQNVAVPQTERTWFKNQRVPPDNWRIWIGRYDRQSWVGQWLHTSFPIYSEKEVAKVMASRSRRPNHQTTTFIVGKLYVHVFSGRFSDIIMRWDWQNAPRAFCTLTQIWPIEYPSIFWPVNTLTDTDAQSFAGAFVRRSAQIASKAGWVPFSGGE